MSITIEGNPIDPKLRDLIEVASKAIAADRNAALGVLNDASRSLSRVIRRAEVPAGLEDIEIVPNRGPAVSFTGKLLCETTFSTKSGMPLDLTLEIYETQGGALVAVSSSVLTGGRGDEDCRAVIVPVQDDALAMRCAVMEFFAWDNHARSMVRKALGWSLRVEVE